MKKEIMKTKIKRVEFAPYMDEDNEVRNRCTRVRDDDVVLYGYRFYN